MNFPFHDSMFSYTDAVFLIVFLELIQTFKWTF